MLGRAVSMQRGLNLGRDLRVAQLRSRAIVDLYHSIAGVRSSLSYRMICRVHRITGTRVGLPKCGNNHSQAEYRRRHRQFPSKCAFHRGPASVSREDVCVTSKLCRVDLDGRRIIKKKKKKKKKKK